MNGTPTLYRYDPLGRRIEKRTGETRSAFVWDGDALAGDAGSAAPLSTVREWVYYPATFEPLAMIGRDVCPGLILYYSNDPNGRPTRLSDPNGELKWAATHTSPLTMWLL
jgi:uncharacterized protein RhaS with RHS repeats